MAEQVEQEAKKNTDEKKALRKKRLTVALALIGAMVILLLLNAIDFESATPPEESTTEYIPVTQPIQNFYEPDYESDITKDAGYLALDRTITYTYDGQSIVLEENDLPDKAFTAFFIRYFNALRAGFAGSSDTSVGFNALYSEVYYRKHTAFDRFAPQKVYDIEITRVGEPQTVTSVEQMADQPYLGATLAEFEVRYKIYKNDGTFRRDISEEDVIPLIFTVMAEKNGTVSVNTVSYIRYEDPSEVAPESILPLIMPIVWIALVPVLAVLAVIFKKKALFIPAILAFAVFLLSLVALVWVQILVFVLGLALALGGYCLLKKKKASAESPTPSAEGLPTEEET